MVSGKIIRESLDTGVWTTAKLRLTDFLKNHQEVRRQIEPPKFSETVEVFKRELENDTGIKPRSINGVMAGVSNSLAGSHGGLPVPGDLDVTDFVSNAFL